LRPARDSPRTRLVEQLVTRPKVLVAVGADARYCIQGVVASVLISAEFTAHDLPLERGAVSLGEDKQAMPFKPVHDRDLLPGTIKCTLLPPSAPRFAPSKSVSVHLPLLLWASLRWRDRRPSGEEEGFMILK